MADKPKEKKWLGGDLDSPLTIIGPYLGRVKELGGEIKECSGNMIEVFFPNNLGLRLYTYPKMHGVLRLEGIRKVKLPDRLKDLTLFKADNFIKLPRGGVSGGETFKILKQVSKIAEG